MGKNLAKVQSMIDGDYASKVQVGYGDQEIERHEIGERWTDSDGREWEQKKGYRVKIKTTPDVGLFSKVCKDCKAPCLKSFDIDTWVRMNRCYGCQTTFELDLKFMRIGETNNKHFFWIKLQKLQRWDAIDKEIEHYMKDLWVRNDKNPFDKTIANAIANHELENTFKVNKNLTK